ncbi:hypothetical protein K443DRAFT_677178 [Laccaria amethystina LaAM-08-1]|uniref:FAD/NAD(P)-binding domain-containing protein n=1 Tax=Laccaria amethystina LaAM-08-1 TaxID=1095629 RepID=A0A0C9XZA5_9AGAR|nr:hypothetical protein K443DRAFT_677178 [Laccaria amethystina LaAM-08-1]
MSSQEINNELHPIEASLPTLSKLGTTAPTDVDATSVASTWLSSFSKFAETGDVEGVTNLLVASDFSSSLLGPFNDNTTASSSVSLYWKDILALTWDLRTFEGTATIKAFLVDRLADAQIQNVKLSDDIKPQLQQPHPDLAWIQLLFTFETKIGSATGIARLVPLKIGDRVEWKGQSIFTHLDSLKGFPEKIGALRNPEPNHGRWEEARRKEVAFGGADPTVLIIGGGQSGLEVAARLKALDVPTLVIEKNERIGDNWRERYEALCLHDPVWYGQFPYLPFPSTWPVFAPSKKLANWLEFYVEALELNVWTSSTVTKATRDEETKLWNVVVRQSNGQDRVFKVKHVVFALGFKGGEGYVPSIPGMESFAGQILHSSQHKRATDHAGKKVVVIGSCTSAHDLCVDYVDHGVDVTMFQRSSTYIISAAKGVRMLLEGLYSENSPPIDIADKLNMSFPNKLIAGLTHRGMKAIWEHVDKDIIEGLHKIGFRTNKGYKDSGLLLTVWQKAGGYYLDVGGSQYLIDGKIKLKNDSQIAGFTERGLKFDNGSELAADVVVFCTGLTDAHYGIRRICGDGVADKCKPLWGMDEEGEINGCWKDLGVPGLWYIMGNLALCRFYSKTIALQIKAMEEGLFSTRYGGGSV